MLTTNSHQMPQPKEHTLKRKLCVQNAVFALPSLLNLFSFISSFAPEFLLAKARIPQLLLDLFRCIFLLIEKHFRKTNNLGFGFWSFWSQNTKRCLLFHAPYSSKTNKPCVYFGLSAPKVQSKNTRKFEKTITPREN